MSDQPDQDDSQERTHQANLQGLLRLAVTNTPSNPDQVITSRITALDPERREWLESALSDLSSSAVQQMQQSLESLENNLNLISSQAITDTTYPDMEDALEDLIEHAASIDNAMDFHKIGGFAVVSKLLNLTEDSVLCKVSDLIAELVQNNPYCQKAALDSTMLPVLCRLLDDTQNSENVRIKALYALSCLIRQNQAALKKFENADGFSILLRAMQSNVKKMKIKIAFLLTSICADELEIQDVLFKMGFVEQLVAMLHLEHDDSHEHLLQALLALVNQHEESIEECKRGELGLQKLLSDRIDEFNGQLGRQEEYDCCLKLMEICFEQRLANHDLER